MNRLAAFIPLIAVMAPAPMAAQSISISERPILSIGSIEGDPNYLLSRVHRVLRLSDGRIVVTMGPDIRFYDSSGRHVSNAGGRGRGPGEFQYIQDLQVLPGDTLLVLHFRDQVWLTPEGKYIRQSAMDLTALAQDGWSSEGATLLPNGNLVAPQYRWGDGDPASGKLYRPPLRYSLFDVARRTIRPLLNSGGLRQMRVGENNSAVQPFTPHPQVAIGPDRLFIGDNDTTVVHVFSFSGDRLGAIRIDPQATRVTASHLSDYRDRILEQIGDNEERRTRFEQGWLAMEKPERFPYWGAAVADQDRMLWVSGPAVPDTPRIWTIYDESGRTVSRVTFPSSFTPMHIGRDFVLGITRDELDVEYVQMYRVERQ